MTVAQLAQQEFLQPVVLPDPQREVGQLYCCDLLSVAMGRAPADGVWVTVMGNINAIAVAVLCDLAAVVIAEEMPIEDAVVQKAQQQGINLLRCALPVYPCARRIDALAGGQEE